MILESHKYAELFPLIQSDNFDEFKQDIACNGLREPIWLYDGKILDGRNRYRACIETGTEIKTREYVGDDPLGFVVSLNLKRRHLDTAQRAMVASRLANMKQGARTDLTEISVMSQPEAAAMLNVSTDSVQFAKKVLDQGSEELIQKVDAGEIAVSTAAKIAELPKEEQVEVVARGKDEIKKAYKEIKAQESKERHEQRINKIIEISKSNTELKTDRTYPVIYADPPWRYDYAESSNRQIENHYPTMDLNDICALPVPEIATKDSILFMWTTSPKLRESFDVLDAWGFEYRTCAVWDKQKIGMGYYFRQQHEILLVATKGEIPAPPVESRISSVISIEREAHSKKPDEFYQIIEAMYPSLPKIELFSRNKRDGWEAWGNQS